MPYLVVLPELRVELEVPVAAGVHELAVVGGKEDEVHDFGVEAAGTLHAYVFSNVSLTFAYS